MANFPLETMFKRVTSALLQERYYIFYVIGILWTMMVTTWDIMLTAEGKKAPPLQSRLFKTKQNKTVDCQAEANSVMGVEVGLNLAAFTNVESQKKGIRIT